MPAPGRPDAPDYDALVVERETSADEGEAIVEEPVMVPEYEPVVEEAVVMPECEVVMEGGVAVEGKVVVHESLVVDHAHMVTTTHAHSAVDSQGARRRGDAEGCNRSQSDRELADHRVPPLWKA